MVGLYELLKNIQVVRQEWHSGQSLCEYIPPPVVVSLKKHLRTGLQRLVLCVIFEYLRWVWLANKGSYIYVLLFLGSDLQPFNGMLKLTVSSASFFLFHIKRSGCPFRENNNIKLSFAVSGSLNIPVPSCMLSLGAWWNLLKGMLVLFSKFIIYAHRMSSFIFWILNYILNFSRFVTFYCRKELWLTVLSRINPDDSYWRTCSHRLDIYTITRYDGALIDRSSIIIYPGHQSRETTLPYISHQSLWIIIKISELFLMRDFWGTLIRAGYLDCTTSRA